MLEGYRGKNLEGYLRGSRFYQEILRGKGYEGCLAHMKRQLCQEQKLYQKADTKVAKTIEFPRKQSSQKARAVRIQQARKKI